MQAEKHLQIRQEAERRYMAMLERACKMLAEQILGTTNDDENGYQGKGTKAPPNTSQNPLTSYPSQSADELRVPSTVQVGPNLHQQQGADCSTESCLTSHDSLPQEGSPPGGKRALLNVDSTNNSFIWGGENDGYVPDLHLVQVSSHGIAGCGV